MNIFCLSPVNGHEYDNKVRSCDHTVPKRFQDIENKESRPRISLQLSLHLLNSSLLHYCSS